MKAKVSGQRSRDEHPRHHGSVADPAGSPRLDDTRDLLEIATQHLTALETRVKRHDCPVNDLHWDAARILTSDTPDFVATPAGQRALRAVQDGSQQLASEIRSSGGFAESTHELLSNASRQLTHLDRLIGALRTTDGEPLSADVAVEMAELAGRAERISMLLEVATPLAHRAQRHLAEAQEALERQVSASAKPDLDRFQQFWTPDVGIFDSSRAVPQARTSTNDDSGLTGRAIHAGAVTSVQLRDLLHHSSQPQNRHQPPSGGPARRDRSQH